MSVDTTFEASQRQLITRHADLIVEELPEERFLRRELPQTDWLRDAFDELTRKHAIDVVDEHWEGGASRHVYKVSEPVRRLAEHAIETRDPFLPCGHRGFKTRNGYLLCRYVGCSQYYNRCEVVDDE